MPSYSGVWNLNAQLQAIKAQNWPMGPGAPTSVTAEPGDASATISFTAPTFTGVPPGITGYRAISSPGGFTATGASSPLTVTGLTNGTAYTFSVDATNGVQYGPAGVSGSVTPAFQRALFALGSSSGGNLNTIDYVSIVSTGDTADFGDLTTSRNRLGACSSSTRGVFAGGPESPSNVIDYVTIASTGNATDFGDLLTSVNGPGGCGSETRGIFLGGKSGASANFIQYITIASVGNSTDWGATLGNAHLQSATFSSTTRGVIGGGVNASGSNTNKIDYVTIATTGASSGFGDLIYAGGECAGCSSNTRGLIAGGGGVNNINYITIATTGNAIDFGDLTLSLSSLSSTSSPTRGLFAGGIVVSTRQNVISYVTIASTGDASDFGDLTVATNYGAGCSNCHGGL